MATIDTGATRSFISEAVARELGTARNQRTILTRISLADGTQRDVTQALVVRIHLGQRYATMPMLVLPTILDDIILGMDFLCEVEGRLECGQAQLQLGPDSSEKTPISITTMPRRYPRPTDGLLRSPRVTGIEHGYHKPAQEPTSSMMAKRRNSHSSPKLRADDITPGKESLGIPEEIWVKQFLQEELGKFEGLTGVSSIAEHTITLRDNRPIKQRYYPKNPAMQKIINDQVDELLRDDRIEPSRSPHTRPSSWLGRRPVTCACAWTTVSLTRDQCRTRTHYRVSTTSWRNSGTPKEPCVPGHVVSEAGIHTDPEKINAIKELAPPTSVKELRRCLGIASWYRRFVPNFTSIVQPISKLLRKGQKWTWDASQERAFQELKTRLTEAPVLACPNFNERFSLQTDASDYGLGAVLTQRIEGIERVIAYASRRLSPAEENYSTTEKESSPSGRADHYASNHGTAERSFRERILARFGVPKTFVCDNAHSLPAAFKRFANDSE
ncbi:hypothetical protein ACLKA6_008588 [Drosophila palustris]